MHKMSTFGILRSLALSPPVFFNYRVNEGISYSKPLRIIGIWSLEVLGKESELDSVCLMKTKEAAQMEFSSLY